MMHWLPDTRDEELDSRIVHEGDGFTVEEVRWCDWHGQEKAPTYRVCFPDRAPLIREHGSMEEAIEAAHEWLGTEE